jgi:hypothetical protein
MPSDTPVYRRLRVAGRLIVAGLLIQCISLLWVHPSAFFLFAFAGALPVAAGILLYFTSLARLEVSEGEGKTK